MARPWLDAWREVTAEMGALQASHPMADAVVDETAGRRIRIGDHWLTDFASCNYLGFDLEPDILRGIPDYLERWGTHPSWSRSIASPALYGQIEARLQALLGSEDVLTLPTLTHIHGSVLPLLAAGGTVLVDARAHMTIHDGATVARARGATVRRYRHGDLDQLERLLRGSAPQPRVVCVDGVNSMTGNVPDLAALARLTRRYEALLYVDDAHGFGVLGERAGEGAGGSPNRYGRRGNALVRHAGESYEGIVLTGGFSKAYSSLLAFVTCSPDLKRLIKAAGSPYAYSGPSPVASLASALLGLELNARRGDLIRTRLALLTTQVLDHLAAAGIWTSNTSGFPVIELPLADPDDLDAVGRHLFRRGVYVTLAPHPVVPRAEVGFRIQVTAANTEPEITHLLEVLDEVHRDFGLRSREGQAVTP